MKEFSGFCSSFSELLLEKEVEEGVGGGDLGPPRLEGVWLGTPAVYESPGDEAHRREVFLSFHLSD